MDGLFNEIPRRFLIDTGSAVSLVRGTSQGDVGGSNPNLDSVTGEPVRVFGRSKDRRICRGTCFLCCRHQERLYFGPVLRNIIGFLGEHNCSIDLRGSSFLLKAARDRCLCGQYLWNTEGPVCSRCGFRGRKIRMR